MGCAPAWLHVLLSRLSTGRLHRDREGLEHCHDQNLKSPTQITPTHLTLGASGSVHAVNVRVRQPLTLT